MKRSLLRQTYREHKQKQSPELEIVSAMYQMKLEFDDICSRNKSLTDSNNILKLRSKDRCNAVTEEREAAIREGNVRSTLHIPSGQRMVISSSGDKSKHVMKHILEHKCNHLLLASSHQVCYLK